MRRLLVEADAAGLPVRCEVAFDNVARHFWERLGLVPPGRMVSTWPWSDRARPTRVTTAGVASASMEPQARPLPSSVRHLLDDHRGLSAEQVAHRRV